MILWLFIQDSDPEFLPIPDTGVKKAPDPGSAILRETQNEDDHGRGPLSIQSSLLEGEEKKGEEVREW